MRITCGTDLLVELGSTLELFHTTRRHRSALSPSSPRLLSAAMRHWA
jgi:hypothetical protein